MVGVTSLNRLGLLSIVVLLLRFSLVVKGFGLFNIIELIPLLGFDFLIQIHKNALIFLHLLKCSHFLLRMHVELHHLKINLVHQLDLLQQKIFVGLVK